MLRGLNRGPPATNIAGEGSLIREEKVMRANKRLPSMHTCSRFFEPWCDMVRTKTGNLVHLPCRFRAYDIHAYRTALLLHGCVRRRLGC